MNFKFPLFQCQSCHEARNTLSSFAKRASQVIALSRALGHPTILGLLGAHVDAGLEAGSPNIYTLHPSSPRWDLRRRLRAERGRLSEMEVQFHAGCLLLALEHLSNVGIIHRHLSPGALLIDTAGYTLLSSFEFAKARATDGSDERTYSLCGSAQHMAPEMILRAGHGRAVDVWGMGTTICEALTGTPAFCCPANAARHNPELQLFALLEVIVRSSGGPSLPARRSLQTASPAAQAFIGAALARDPNERPTATLAGPLALRSLPFFAGLDLDALYHRFLPSPWRPPAEPPVRHTELRTALLDASSRWRYSALRSAWDRWAVRQQTRPLRSAVEVHAMAHGVWQRLSASAGLGARFSRIHGGSASRLANQAARLAAATATERIARRRLPPSAECT